MIAQDLEQILKRGIPIAAEMGIRDLHIQDHKLTLKLPLSPNINHKQTMFGGSLYAAGALACYGLFLAGLREQSILTNDIVISEGDMKYIAPVNEDAMIQAQWSSEAEMKKFFKSLQSKSKARVLMRAQVLLRGQVCAEFSGHFVAQLKG
jgi:thioesterase domain-containing protein